MAERVTEARGEMELLSFQLILENCLSGKLKTIKIIYEESFLVVQ